MKKKKKDKTRESTERTSGLENGSRQMHGASTVYLLTGQRLDSIFHCKMEGRMQMKKEREKALETDKRSVRLTHVCFEDMLRRERRERKKFLVLAWLERSFLCLVSVHTLEGVQKIERESVSVG